MSDKAAKTKSAKGGRFAGIKRFFAGVKAEFRKIIWPDRDTLLKQLLAVLVVTAIVAIMIALIDYGVQHLIDLLVGIQLPAAASDAASTAATAASTAATAAESAASAATEAASAVSTAASEIASTAASIAQ